MTSIEGMSAETSLSRLQWRARHVPAGTPYWDEPTEYVPEGWYVVACDRDPMIAPGEDVVAEVRININLEQGDFSGEVARRIAGALNDEDTSLQYAHTTTRFAEIRRALFGSTLKAACGEPLTVPRGRPAPPPVGPDAPECPACRTRLQTG